MREQLCEGGKAMMKTLGEAGTVCERGNHVGKIIKEKLVEKTTLTNSLSYKNPVRTRPAARRANISRKQSP